MKEIENKNMFYKVIEWKKDRERERERERERDDVVNLNCQLTARLFIEIDRRNTLKIESNLVDSRKISNLKGTKTKINKRLQERKSHRQDLTYILYTRFRNYVRHPLHLVEESISYVTMIDINSLLTQHIIKKHNNNNNKSKKVLHYAFTI